jgi:hypothetical protein
VVAAELGTGVDTDQPRELNRQAGFLRDLANRSSGLGTRLPRPTLLAGIKPRSPPAE